MKNETTETLHKDTMPEPEPEPVPPFDETRRAASNALLVGMETAYSRGYECAISDAKLIVAATLAGMFLAVVILRQIERT